MAPALAGHSNPGNNPSLREAREGQAFHRSGNLFRRFALFAAVVLLSPFVIAQGTPQVTGVDPPSGKVNDSVAVAGENLGKASVSGVFLSNDKDDFKATIVEQNAEKIIVKIPQVKSGVYNVSILVGDKLLIKPVRFTVQE